MHSLYRLLQSKNRPPAPRRTPACGSFIPCPRTRSPTGMGRERERTRPLPKSCLKSCPRIRPKRRLKLLSPMPTRARASGDVAREEAGAAPLCLLSSPLRPHPPLACGAPGRRDGQPGSRDGALGLPLPGTELPGGSPPPPPPPARPALHRERCHHRQPRSTSRAIGPATAEAR